VIWIGDLVWNEWNENHIARHHVSVEEVEELVFEHRYHITRLRGDRYLIIGRTNAGRLLSVIADRERYRRFYVVTARDAAPNERNLYRRHVLE
jgi:uncharacterized DUF497 family protein